MGLSVRLYSSQDSDDELFGQNITHNLSTMAHQAGIYEPLWRPDENGITTAGELIQPLTIGLEKLKASPEYFEQFNASNGWGRYEQFVPWVEKYLNACIEYPNALVSVNR